MCGLDVQMHWMTRMMQKAFIMAGRESESAVIILRSDFTCAERERRHVSILAISVCAAESQAVSLALPVSACLSVPFSVCQSDSVGVSRSVFLGSPFALSLSTTWLRLRMCVSCVFATPYSRVCAGACTQPN